MLKLTRITFDVELNYPKYEKLLHKSYYIAIETFYFTICIYTVCFFKLFLIFCRLNLKFPWSLVVFVLFLSVGLGEHCVWAKLFGKLQRCCKNSIIGMYKPIRLKTV